jgi:PadR family transcriptional regulator PadR
MRTPSLSAVTVLHAVARGYCYGFDVIEQTGLPSGTVYPALSRLERDGYVRSTWEDERVARQEGRPARRNYEVTARGAQVLAQALERYHALRPVRARPLRGRS